jgi:hypothetical protein
MRRSGTASGRRRRHRRRPPLRAMASLRLEIASDLPTIAPALAGTPACYSSFYTLHKKHATLASTLYTRNMLL